jgi:hypothetical protein
MSTTETSPDRLARERDLVRRGALLAHVLFVLAALVSVAFVGTLLHATVLACVLGAVVFGAWAVYRWRAEDSLAREQLANQRQPRTVRTGWADERPPGPRLAVPTPGVGSVSTPVTGAVVAPSAAPNRIVPPDPE